MGKKGLRQKKTPLVIAAGAVLILMSLDSVKAAAKNAPAAVGIEDVLKQSPQNDVIRNMKLYLAPDNGGKVLNRAFFDGEDFIFIRENPDKESGWTGKLYPGNAAEVLKYLDGWAKIKSGNACGYVPADCLLTGNAAREYDMLFDKTKAAVTADALNVREKAGTDSRILRRIFKGERYGLAGAAQKGWYPIDADGIKGWVCGKYITIEKDYKYAESREEEEERRIREETITKGQSIVDFACRFIGNPYVWGGTSLTDGADCSGFVQSVYKNFGIFLPRTTWDMESAGRPVKYKDALPGDLVLYEGHVGLYMGDGNIVNAMNSRRGIVVVDASYAPIKTIRRVL